MTPSNTPTVSVIVPNYNHARFLRKRLDTVLRQTFRDFEVILLDDCSADDSRAILSSYANDPRVRIELNDANSGSTFKQWNKGVRLARGEYVWIAESDDYAHERMLERLVAVLDADPKVAFAYCRSWRISANDELDGYADYYLADIDPHRWTADYLADGAEECRNYFVRITTVPNASAVVFRKALYDQVGGADESFRMCGDWKLWAAMALTGKVAYVGESLNYFRFHGAITRSKVEETRLDVTETLRVVSWILGKVTPTEAVLEKLCEWESARWGPVVLSTHVPFRVKWTILRCVREIDPHPVRSVLHVALCQTRSAARNYLWHPILNRTRPVRHLIGLNQANISTLRTKLGLGRVQNRPE